MSPGLLLKFSVVAFSLIHQHQDQISQNFKVAPVNATVPPAEEIAADSRSFALGLTVGISIGPVVDIAFVIRHWCLRVRGHILRWACGADPDIKVITLRPSRYSKGSN